MKLDAFFNRMKTYLDEQTYHEFESSFNQSAYKGIRVNPLRVDVAQWLSLAPFAMRPTPFSKDHFYVKEEVKGHHPYHLAGLFYMQEPSAGSAVEILDIQEGDIVLDLCAAPGGKSTQIAAKLNRRGLLVSNEIVVSRAQVLLSNIERMGVSNAIITNTQPANIAKTMPYFFHKILVDAPCSGEGMFRKDVHARAEWSESHVLSCATRQFPILEAAYQALAHQGTMVYSTCTFSKQENEQMIASFLKMHQDMSLVSTGATFGREGIPTEGMDASLVRRVYPMDGGEGHFIAKLVKNNPAHKNDAAHVVKSAPKTDKNMSIVQAFLHDQLHTFDPARILLYHDMAYYVPSRMPDVSSLHLIRAGICIGEIAKGILHPHHQFYMGLEASAYRKCISMPLNDSRVMQYLQGHEITDESDITGYCGIQVDGYMLGFGKKNNHVIKNHYPKGLRIQR